MFSYGGRRGSDMLQNTDIAIGSDGSGAENSPEKPKKKRGKKKLPDREEYSASVHSSDLESEGGTDGDSVARDDMVEKARKKKKSTLLQDFVDISDQNYCGLCGTIHSETCHMVQNPDNLVDYRAMLMEVTNGEPIGIRVSYAPRCTYFRAHKPHSEKRSKLSTRNSRRWESLT